MSKTKEGGLLARGGIAQQRPEPRTLPAQSDNPPSRRNRTYSLPLWSHQTGQTQYPPRHATHPAKSGAPLTQLTSGSWCCRKPITNRVLGGWCCRTPITNSVTNPASEVGVLSYLTLLGNSTDGTSTAATSPNQEGSVSTTDSGAGQTLNTQSRI